MVLVDGGGGSGSGSGKYADEETKKIVSEQEMSL